LSLTPSSRRDATPRDGVQAAQRDLLIERVRRGYWPGIGETAVILGVSRKTVDRLLKPQPPGILRPGRPEVIRHETRSGDGGWRVCHPHDVLAELERDKTGRRWSTPVSTDSPAGVSDRAAAGRSQPGSSRRRRRPPPAR
jgi:hypothetical protein